jgi:hypothetical protein
MKRFTILFGLVLLLAMAAIPRALSAIRSGQQVTNQAETNSQPANESKGTVRATMQNVDFHLTDRIVAHISNLTGKLTPTQPGIPTFDDKKSFMLDIDSANITVSAASLTSDLNDFVFVKPDAPLKKLSVTTQGDQLVMTGILASKGGLSFETAGTLTATPDGMIRIHTTRVKALHLPVKGLMDMLGLSTETMLNTKNVPGVTVDKDDLILDPAEILPPPKMRGHLNSIRVQNGGIALSFGNQDTKGKTSVLTSTCGGRNFMAFKGGTVRFGKLTMTDADMELVELQPADAFDFSIDRYMQQLVAGYSKITPKGGLCAHVPDLNKIQQPPNTKK